MASGPTTARQREGEMVEVVTDVLFLGSKVTVDGYCSHEIRRCLLLGRKAMTNLESVLKSRDITPWTQVLAAKAMLSPVVTYGCELDCKGSGDPKNWCLRTMVLEKIPESPLDCKDIKPVNLKGNQPWVLIGRTDAEVEIPVFWSSDTNSWFLGESLMLGKIERRRRRGCQRIRRLDGITNAMNSGKLWEMVRDGQAWNAAVHGVSKSWAWLGDWITTIISNVEHLFMCLLAICMSSLGKYLFSSSAHFIIWLGCFFFLMYWVLLYKNLFNQSRTLHFFQL